MLLTWVNYCQASKGTQVSLTCRISAKRASRQSYVRCQVGCPWRGPPLGRGTRTAAISGGAVPPNDGGEPTDRGRHGGDRRSHRCPAGPVNLAPSEIVLSGCTFRVPPSQPLFHKSLRDCLAANGDRGSGADRTYKQPRTCRVRTGPLEGAAPHLNLLGRHPCRPGRALNRKCWVGHCH